MPASDRSPGSSPNGGAGEVAYRPPARRIAWTVVRVVCTVAGLTALYYSLPLDHASAVATLAMLLGGLAGFTALVVLQVRSIIRSPHPGLRAVESLTTSVPFFLLLFSASYVALASLSPASFGEHLTHTDGLYFTVTVFSTVGFGDITAKTDTARLVVTVQMLADLIVLGLAVKVFVGAVRRSRSRRRRVAAPSGDDGDEGADGDDGDDGDEDR